MRLLPKKFSALAPNKSNHPFTGILTNERLRLYLRNHYILLHLYIQLTLKKTLATGFGE